MISTLETTADAKPRVLVVEDDQPSHDVLRRILERRGFEVLSATSVAHAVALLDASPHYVILDLMLPDGDGETVLKRIRDESLPIRVLVASALCDTERIARVEELRPDGVFMKPIRLSDLLSTMSAS